MKNTQEKTTSDLKKKGDPSLAKVPSWGLDYLVAALDRQEAIRKKNPPPKVTGLCLE